jgi:hypothetical protein
MKCLNGIPSYHLNMLNIVAERNKINKISFFPNVTMLNNLCLADTKDIQTIQGTSDDPTYPWQDRSFPG